MSELNTWRQKLVEIVHKKYDPIWKILYGKCASGRKLVSIANKMLDQDDINSACYLGLCKSASKYDPKKRVRGKKVSFVTYATNGIFNELRHAIEADQFRCKDYKTRPKQVDSNKTNPGELDLLFCNMSTLDPEPHLDQEEMVEKLIRGSNELVGRIVSKKYGVMGYPQLSREDIAVSEGMTETQIKNILHNAVMDIREEYEGKTLFSTPRRFRTSRNSQYLEWKKWIEESFGSIPESEGV